MPSRFSCDHSLRTRIADHLGAFDVRPLARPEATSAAVALAVVEEAYGADLSRLPQHTTWQSTAALLLTRRSSRLKNHPGQWALPGGRLDPGETPEQAALREMHEEVGLAVSPSAILGRLDDYETRSGFVITPIVVWVGRADAASPNPDEVDSIHRIPVDEFLRPDAPIVNDEYGARDDAEHRRATLSEPSASATPVLRMPVGDTWIAAPTAAFLYQFAQVCLEGNPLRVAHFDQPKFAWS